MKKLLRILATFYTLDPRWLYLAAVIVLVLPMIFPFPLPKGIPTRGTIGLYDMAANCPSNKVILIDSSWDQGSKPETASQLSCFVKDLCHRKVRFVVISTASPYAPDFAMDIIEPIAKEAGAVYGEDWVHLGFIGIVQAADSMGGVGAVVIDSFCRDVHKARPVDIHGTPVSEIPIMQAVKTAEDCHFVFAINYCPDLAWVSFGKEQHGLPVAFGCAAMMSPYYYLYVDSGQMAGLMTGNRGAYEYESMTGVHGKGFELMRSFAFGHCFIIIAAILGNIGYWSALKLRRMDA